VKIFALCHWENSRWLENLFRDIILRPFSALADVKTLMGELKNRRHFMDQISHFVGRGPIEPTGVTRNRFLG